MRSTQRNASSLLCDGVSPFRTALAGIRPSRRSRPSKLGDPATIGYVAKFPPSTSGIALYASVFERVLAADATVVRVYAPPDPRISQRLRSAVAGLLSAGLTPKTFTQVHVELSGRGLFEFWYTVGLLLRRRTRPLITITCHDAPSLVGGTFLFACLDRRGFRRLGMALSRVIGRRLERYVMRSCDAVFVLTHEGSETMSETYKKIVFAIPHVVDAPTSAAKSKLVFIPGYVADAKDIIEAARAVISHGQHWQLVVGACPQSVETEARLVLGEACTAVTFLGTASEELLRSTFSSAAIVLRLRRERGANELAASGPLCWALSHECICITNDTRAGARELAAAGLIHLSADPVADLRSLLAENQLAARLPSRELVQSRLGIQATRERYRRALDVTSRCRTTSD